MGNCLKGIRGYNPSWLCRTAFKHGAVFTRPHLSFLRVRVSIMTTFPVPVDDGCQDGLTGFKKSLKSYTGTISERPEY
jgi:hypothetical protein